MDIHSQVSVPNEGELFCFRIEELGPATYLNDFLNNINAHLPGYVFDRDSLAVHEQRLQAGLTHKTPLERAREFLQKTQAGRAFDSGEFGEFLLYLFAKEVKGAHKLASKIQARGSVTSTLPGRDNTFGWCDENGDVYMLIGEAKTVPDSNDGLRDAQSDLNAFWNSGRINHEINLASTHIRAEMTEANAMIFEAFFIDDNPAHASLRYKNVVFVGYSLNSLTNLRSDTSSEAQFIASVHENLQRCFLNQGELINASPVSSIYCFVPFESIDTARTAFAQTNNLVI